MKLKKMIRMMPPAKSAKMPTITSRIVLPGMPSFGGGSAANRSRLFMASPLRWCASHVDALLRNAIRDAERRVYISKIAGFQVFEFWLVDGPNDYPAGLDLDAADPRVRLDQNPLRQAVDTAAVEFDHPSRPH